MTLTGPEQKFGIQVQSRKAPGHFEQLSMTLMFGTCLLRAFRGRPAPATA